MDAWYQQAKRVIKGELVRRGISYEMLSEMLKTIGINETSANINVKLNRGSFTFAFVLQIMKALDIKVLRVEE